MKYYYSNGSNFKKLLFSSKDESRIDNDLNKIIVIAGRNYCDYNVLEMDRGSFEKEKKELSYGALINYLIGKDKNTYYLNMPFNEAANINHCVNEGITKEVFKHEQDINPIYVLNGEEILKVNVKIDKNIIKEAILSTYEEDLYDSSNKYKRLSLADFASNKELINLYKLPIIQRDNSFVVPKYSYATPSLFYILNDIYNDSLDKIELSDKNIFNLYQFSDSKYSKILDKVFDNMEVEVLGKYDAKDLKNNIDFYHKIKFDREYGRDVREEARSIANYSAKIISNAKSNEKVFYNLYLIKDDNIEKSLKLRKND